MERFLIQTHDGRIEHDFAFALMQAVDYHAWLRGTPQYETQFVEQISSDLSGVPIGSLEFVFEYMRTVRGIPTERIRPINIPEELRTGRFLGRAVHVASRDEITLARPVFLKSHTRYKGFTDVMSDLKDVPDDTYLISDVVDFVSEWRGFVQGNTLVGLQNYSGEFDRFPDAARIREMIEAYRQSPKSYTLDVGIMNSGATVVIEVHPFVSCGLYGFRDYARLPSMLIQGFSSMLGEASCHL